MFRIGHGYDVHKLTEGRPLILGGVEILYNKGLLGHSDADVLVHAIMDSLLGAAGMRDIGYYFPDDDDAYREISSLVLLRKVYEMLQNAGYHISNIDSTVIAQRPRLSPYIPAMRQKIAAVLNMDADAVNVKATTEEEMGFTGSGAGIAAHAVCLLSK